MPQQIAALKVARRAVLWRSHPGGSLKLFDRFVQKLHLFVSQTQIIVRLVIAICGRRFFFSRCAKFIEDFCEAGINPRFSFDARGRSSGCRSSRCFSLLRFRCLRRNFLLCEDLFHLYALGFNRRSLFRHIVAREALELDLLCRRRSGNV